MSNKDVSDIIDEIIEEDDKIKIAIIGIGNCASSLVQGIYYYRIFDENKYVPPGLMHWKIGDYLISDINIVAAFDVDKRKVGKFLSNAIFSEPNCTKYLEGDENHHPMIFITDENDNEIKVLKAPVLDGVADHMKDYFQVDENQKELSKGEIIKVLKDGRVDIIINYLPVGSQVATEFWAEVALEAGCGFINCIPVFIGSDETWVKKFEDAGLPLVGDDVKSQMGATIIHRMLANLFKDRGVKLERTYQLNCAGNTDFLNMLDRNRLKSKKTSKTEAIQSVFPLSERLSEEDIHVGPSDYVPWLKDNKICFLRMEGQMFGDIPMNLELRLSVEDSPNSAGCVIDAIRCTKIALDRGIGGSLAGVSAYYMKHPLIQYPDEVARCMVEDFINEETTWRNR